MLIDSHAHIDLPDFAGDRGQVLARAREQGVAAIINVGIDVASSREALHLARSHAEVFAAVGVHPNSSAAFKDADFGQLAELAGDPATVAIGEIGLDFYRESSPRPRQLAVFQQQLELAAGRRLPVIIHSRNAGAEAWDVLSRWAKSAPPLESGLRGAMHCFSGDMVLARRYIELGFLISVAGQVTYPRAADRVTVARELPLDKMLVETDAPFLAPQLHRGRRNEPAYVSLIVDGIAQIRGIPAEEVARATAQNAIRLFRLPLPQREECACQSMPSTN